MSKVIERREKLIDYLLAHGWQPGHYLFSVEDGPHTENIDTRGKLKRIYGVYNYFTVAGYYAVVSQNSLNIFKVQKRLIKIWNCSIKDITYHDDGLSAGILKLMNVQGDHHG